jgi:hypothetical protein
MASADSSLRFAGVALSGARRGLPRYEHPPSPHDRRIYAAPPWPSRLRDHWLARLARQRLYPVPVRRPAVSLPASSPRSVALPQLRFASLAMACSREDFHLRGNAPCWAHQKKSPGRGAAGASGMDDAKNPGNVLLSHQATLTVPSALEGLTAVFGMGTGVTPPPWSPG